tara:strand:+ start:1512 stop:1997 length:486 start_codon:yes stop_codon:yes gene_type:complete
MINKNICIIFILLSTFCFSQSINIGSKVLEIGMDKKKALELLKNHIDLSNENLNRENFWIRNKNQIVGSIGFIDEKLSYVTTNWDNDLEYLDSIEMFNTLYDVLKNTFGSKFEGEIILKLEEVNEPNLDKIGISIHSNEGKSVTINRKNISLDIKQIAQKL